MRSELTIAAAQARRARAEGPAFWRRKRAREKRRRELAAIIYNLAGLVWTSHRLLEEAEDSGPPLDECTLGQAAAVLSSLSRYVRGTATWWNDRQLLSSAQCLVSLRRRGGRGNRISPMGGALHEIAAVIDLAGERAKRRS
jgi:hypothetical protein